jgi:ABC-type dipeptide/oligopeptide/nickel transport system permease component
MLMLPFFARRLALSLAGLLAMSLLVLLLLSFAPGDAASVMAGDVASTDQMAALRAEMGLGQSTWGQWIHFWKELVTQGSLGRSLYSGRPVLSEISSRLPYTLALAAASMTISLVVGILAGLWAAARCGTWIDSLLMGSATLGMGIPRFWLAMLLVLVFSLWLGWLPVTGAGSPRHIVLPAICLGLPAAATFARLTRANALDVIHSDHVLVARAKGLSRYHIFSRHVLRNSLIPVVTVAGLHLGHLIGGAFIIETIFAWPGLSRLAVQAVFNRDWPLIMGTSLSIALVFIITNLSVDLLYHVLDPRIGRGTRGGLA